MPLELIRSTQPSINPEFNLSNPFDIIEAMIELRIQLQELEQQIHTNPPPKL